MSPTQLVLLALFVGALIGAGLCAILFIAQRARERAEQENSTVLPDGITAVLSSMDDAAAAIDASGLVVATSQTAPALGVEEQATLTDGGLRDLLKLARTAGAATETIRIRLGPLQGQQRLVAARMTRLTERYFLLILRDVSEQERLEAMRQDFIANTSHELKTPVGAITLLSEAIEFAADDPDEVRRFASRLSAEAERLGQLTGRIMHLSRLQAADQASDMSDVAIDEVVTAALEANSVAAAGAGVGLVRGGDRGLWVHGDVHVLIEAVSNLISNAVSYSPKGSHVGIGVKNDGVSVDIAVSDQGIGIAESDQERVFERFYRADQARSRRTGGTGLGLSIVKHAVYRHGGEVKLWSQPKKGSTFTIRLPLVGHPEPEPEGGTTKQKKAARRKKENA
ncbi:sensor histidine kinase [Microbacterium halophytorum]|uniref:sensor histidine kinase n=1 Tax=Microbacterium halophytorum TaxID=2067568 RepID=UPI000CFC41E3|nr:ATP-binding protein [Microbacterium halophytorum]